MGQQTTANTSPTRRRSQRLFLQIRVVVEGKPIGKPSFQEKTRTIIVNAHGALVELGVSVDQGQTLIIVNSQTNEKQESIVKLVSAGEGRKLNVALEFTTANPDFWGITFPPEDWTAKHPEAKRAF